MEKRQAWTVAGRTVPHANPFHQFSIVTTKCLTQIWARPRSIAVASTVLLVQVVTMGYGTVTRTRRTVVIS
jgi:hypothetical protein